MKISNFMSAVYGKKIDWDSVCGVQCVDLPKKYIQLCFGVPTTKGKAVWGDAADWWHFGESGYAITKALKPYFFKIKNTPSFVPALGDIAVWGSKYQKSGDGHVALCTGDGNTRRFAVWEQNTTGNHEGVQCIWHNYYKDFKGVLRPYRTVRADVNVRSSPRVATNNLVGELKAGEKVAVYEVVNGWAKIGTNKYCAVSYINSL